MPRSFIIEDPDITKPKLVEFDVNNIPLSEYLEFWYKFNNNILPSYNANNYSLSTSSTGFITGKTHNYALDVKDYLNLYFVLSGGYYYTISFWIYPKTASFTYILRDNTGVDFWYFDNFGSVDKLYFTTRSAWDGSSSRTSNYININTWSHVCITRKAGYIDPNVKIYFNSEESSWINPISPIDLDQNAFKIFGNSGISLNGYINDFMLHYNVLSQEQIKTLMSLRDVSFYPQQRPNILTYPIRNSGIPYVLST